MTTPLKLVAFDAEDLQTISTLLQDGVVKLGDINHAPEKQQFIMVLNRFAWDADTSGKSGKSGERRRTGVHFNHVTDVKSKMIDQTAKQGILSLLSVTFEPGENPAGTVVLNFSGGGTLSLQVDCLEAQLRDLGGVWAAKAVPSHTDD